VGDKIFNNGMHDQLLAMTSQLIGITVSAAAGGSDKDQAIAGWVASQATKFNYLEHEERVAFTKAMGGCGTNDDCSREKWEQGKFDEDSKGNLEYAKDITGSQRATMARDRIMDDLDALIAMPCGNSTCENYKQLLVNRSLDAIEYLSGVIKDWAPTYDRIGLLGGAAMGAEGAKTTLQVGESAISSRIQKAIDYLVGAKGGAKAPKTVEKISNPPQAPIIPSDWVSRPGRNGGEIYFPAGTDPAKGEHIRVMPPGSSPVPGYEDGYWRWQNSGKQPMNPATGKPGIGQGDTHVPLPPDSVPPVRR
jgi:filamentous hemagglutinin